MELVSAQVANIKNIIMVKNSTLTLVSTKNLNLMKNLMQLIRFQTRHWSKGKNQAVRTITLTAGLND